MMPLDIFEEEKRKKEEERAKSRNLAIKAFIAFAGLAIVIITQNFFSYNLIKALLFLMLLVLILGFWGNSICQILKNYLEKRRHDQLAKLHFKKFKELVIRFKEFIKNYPDDHMQTNIPTVLNRLKNDSADLFSKIPVIEPGYIQYWYKYYSERLKQFDGTKNSLMTLAREFEDILVMYDRLYIKDPVNAVRSIGKDKVPEQNKELYSIARLKYINFVDQYENFAKVSNEYFKEKEKSTYSVEAIIFRESFEERPKEL